MFSRAFVRTAKAAPRRAAQPERVAFGVSAVRVPLSVAASALSGPVIQRVEKKVKKGDDPPQGWKFLRTEGKRDIYDDGQPADIDVLKPTRDVIGEIDPDELSDISESETEIDPKTKPKKVYRVNNPRDVVKLTEKVLHKNSNENFGARIGGGTVFRLQGKGTQFFVNTVAEGKLGKRSGTATGATPKRPKTAPKPTGSKGSYQHVVSELRNYTPEEVGQVIYDRFISKATKPYPAQFSEYAKAKMDEMITLLAIAEGYRTTYALGLFVAAVRALMAGRSFEDVLYKGTGQLDALHPGASSVTKSKVSGQLMEQNLGLGYNAPHPTQKSTDLKPEQFEYGAQRARELFEVASSGTTPEQMLRTHLMPHFESRRKIDNLVSSVLTPPWRERLIVELKQGQTLADEERVRYRGSTYVVNGNRSEPQKNRYWLNKKR